MHLDAQDFKRIAGVWETESKRRGTFHTLQPVGFAGEALLLHHLTTGAAYRVPFTVRGQDIAFGQTLERVTVVSSGRAVAGKDRDPFRVTPGRPQRKGDSGPFRVAVRGESSERSAGVKTTKRRDPKNPFAVTIREVSE